MNDRPKSSNSKFLINFLAGILAALFVFSTIIVLLTFFPTKQILNPDFYKQILADQGVYQRLPKSLAGQLAAEISQDSCLDNPDALNCIDENGSLSAKDRPIPLLILEQEELESILTQVVDPDWLQTQTEQIIDQFFELLLNSDDPANTPIVISLNEIKARLAGTEGTQAVLSVLDAQSPCSVEQLLGLLQMGLGMPSSIESLLCRPPDYVFAELNPVIKTSMAGVVELVPDQLFVSLPDTLTGNPNSGNSQESYFLTPNPIRILRGTRTVVSISPLLPLLFLSVMTLMVVRSMRDFLLWWGISFLAAGTITLFLTLIMLPITNWTITQLLPEWTTILWILRLLGELGAGEIFNELINRLLNSIRIPAGLIFLSGLLMLVGSLFVKDRTSPLKNSQDIELDNLKR